MPTPAWPPVRRCLLSRAVRGLSHTVRLSTSHTAVPLPMACSLPPFRFPPRCLWLCRVCGRCCGSFSWRSRAIPRPSLSSQDERTSRSQSARASLSAPPDSFFSVPSWHTSIRRRTRRHTHRCRISPGLSPSCLSSPSRRVCTVPSGSPACQIPSRRFPDSDFLPSRWSSGSSVSRADLCMRTARQLSV